MLTPKKLEDLKKPFSADDIEWRIGRQGLKDGKPWAVALAYISARAVMARLDEVCGPENWYPSYQVFPNGITCKLSIRVAGEWIAKEDGAEQTDVEAFKGGISSALKRAASVWSIGRYLYALEDAFVDFVPKGTKGALVTKIENQVFFWLPPKLPAWALPEKASGHDNKSSDTDLNHRLGIGSSSPRPVSHSERENLAKKIYELHPTFSEIFKENMPALLGARYGVSDSRHMTLEQLKDLLEFMEATLGLAQMTPPESRPLPEHPLDTFVVKVALKGLKGRTFKDIGRSELEREARGTFKWFKNNNKRFSRDWTEFFDRAAEYCFGSADGSLFTPDQSGALPEQQKLGA